MTTQPTEKIFTREFILNFFAQFSFTLVSFILIPTLPIYLSRLEAKGGEIGFLIGVLSVFSLLPRPFIGRAFQRIPERQFMIAGAGLYILSSIAYILAPPFWPFLIVRILQGLGLAFFSTASFTLMANIAAGIHQGQVISYYYMSFNFAFALAPYFGMVLINQFNFTVLFLVCAGLSLCALVITAKMGKMERPLTEDRSIQNQPIWSREFLPPILMAFSLNLIWSSLGAFFPLYALRHGVSNPGIFFTVYAIALIVGRGFGGRILDTYERRRVMIPCLITVVLSLVLLTFSTTLGMFVVAGLILGSGWSLLYPCLALYVIENAGPARGPAMSIFTALGDLGAGIGPMVMGIVLQWTSYPAMFGGLILIGVLNLLFFCSVTGKGRWGRFFRWPVGNKACL